MNIQQVPAHTNNYGKGRAGKTVKFVIVHWIVGSLASADATFKNPNRKASAHYGIENGTVHQYVNENDTAWHASNLAVNRESIGIEHSGGELLSDKKTRRKPSEQTHKTSGELVGEICRRYNIPIDRNHILPHNKFSATQCPGSLDIDKIIDYAKGSDSIDNDLKECLRLHKQLVDEIEHIHKPKIRDLEREREELRSRIQSFEARRQELAQLLSSSDDFDEIKAKVEGILKQEDQDSSLSRQLADAKLEIDVLNRTNEKLDKDLKAMGLQVTTLERELGDLAGAEELRKEAVEELTKTKQQLTDCKKNKKPKGLVNRLIWLFS